MFSKKQVNIPHIEPVKFIEKGNGVIKGYAVNTSHGMVKDYNEDRVSIIMNITKPNFKGRWPKCSYFGVFDGHGGDQCSNFLKDNMHKYITENQFFPHQPIEALKTGFRKAQTQFLRHAESQVPFERSGSCAVVVLVIDQMCYIANVGDSRAILSAERGSKVYALSYDHKPDATSEKSRIQKAGGKIYQSIIKAKNGMTFPGPFRINPGKLSVSRSFGDIQAKLQKYGGNPKVLIAKPEITYFQITDQHDFIVMGSDGIFDKLTNQEIADCFWQKHANKKIGNQFIGEASSMILTQSMNKMSMDNITSLIVVFEDNGKLELPRKQSVVGLKNGIENVSIKENKENKDKQNRQINQNYHQNNQQSQQSYKQMLNVAKSDRDLHSLNSRVIQKLSARKKSSTNIQVQQEPAKMSNKQIQVKNVRTLKKDNTMKVLPTHKTNLNSEQMDKYSSGSLLKALRNKNIQKNR